MNPTASLTALLENVADAVCLIDAERRVLAFNDPFVQFWREAFAMEAAIGMTVDALPETAHFWRDFIVRALRGRAILADGWHDVSGVKRYFSVSSAPILGDSASEGTAIIIRDITLSRRKGHRELMELALTRIFEEDSTVEENLEKLIEFICEADGWQFGVVWLADEHETLAPVAFWHDGSPRAAAFAATVGELRFARGHGIPGRAYRDGELVWVPDLTDETGVVRSAPASRLGFHGVAALPVSDSHRTIGVIELFTRAMRPLNDEAARALHDTGLAVGRLIERQRAEEERHRLRKAIERKGIEWALTFDAIESPIFLTAIDGTVVRLNRAARDLAGAPDYASILSRPIRDLGDSEMWRTLGDLVTAVGDMRESCAARATDAHDRHWDVSGSIYAADAEDRVIVILRDITKIVTLQESVRLGEQLAAMGELVAGVAHEVRNPLFGMQITLDAYEPLIQEASNQSSDATEMFAALRTWIERLNLLMENLLEYGKAWRVDLKEGRLHEVVEQAIASSAPIAERSRVRVRAESADDLVMLMDSARLGHAVQNLIINAVQYSPAEGEVEVVARRVGGQAHGVIECVVRDRGPGFEAADIPRIFQPFFTRRRGGTGLGLSIVQRVVDEHGGTVAAENGTDGGAVVTMRFPEFRSAELSR
jgi:signal transduction histidine kinase